MTQVQTPPASASGKDVALLITAMAAVLGGIVAFYWFEELPLLARVPMVLGGIAAGAGLVWLSSYGDDFWEFAQAARVELRKVVWPTRDATVKTTGVVFFFALMMGVFFFLLDMLLTWMTRFVGGQ
jgi:preprotein translocase subunit SecE